MRAATMRNKCSHICDVCARQYKTCEATNYSTGRCFNIHTCVDFIPAYTVMNIESVGVTIVTVKDKNELQGKEFGWDQD